jgi:exoribonuclease-2
VRVKLGEMDLITLDISGTVVDRLDSPVATPGEADSPDEDAEDDEVSGPIAIAVDVSEPAEAPTDNPAP